MSDADRTRWEEKYAAGSHREEAPVPFVAEALADAPRGRALDVACGCGRHAIVLADLGYEVDAVDISPLALECARERAGSRAIRFLELDLDVADLEEHAYHAVISVDFSSPTLAPRLVSALAPGGILVHIARPHALCRFGPRPDAILAWYAPLETLIHQEDAGRVSYAGRLG